MVRSDPTCERCIRGLPLFLWAALALSRISSKVYIQHEVSPLLRKALPFFFSPPPIGSQTIQLDAKSPLICTDSLQRHHASAEKSKQKIYMIEKSSGFEALHSSDFALLQAAILGLREDSSYLEGYRSLRAFVPTHTLFLDVDGVLTNGRVSVDSAGGTHRQYAIQDGAAIKRLIMLGIRIVWVSAAPMDRSITSRASMLSIPPEHVFCGIKDKERFVLEYTKSKSLWGCAFVGDEKRDTGAMHCVGHSYCPADAQPSAIKAAQKILNSKGGEGVVAEVEQDIQRRNDFRFRF